MEPLTVDRAVDLVIAVDQLNVVVTRSGRTLKNRAAEASQESGKPGKSRLCKLIARNTRHLHSAIAEELDIHFLVDAWCHRLADNECRLVEEDVLRLLAACQLVTRARANDNLLLELGNRLRLCNHFLCCIGGNGLNRLVLELERTLVRPAERDRLLVKALEKSLQIESGPEMGGDNHCRDSKRCESKLGRIHLGAGRVLRWSHPHQVLTYLKSLMNMYSYARNRRILR